jgi:flagellar basal body rod protein FlgC
MVDLINSMFIAASGMKAQSDRLRVVAQNIATRRVAVLAKLHIAVKLYRLKIRWIVKWTQIWCELANMA